ncbi:MAG: dockerin type I repeat-containing protein, partial [Ruminococcus sp.]
GDLNEFAIYGYAVSDEVISGDVNSDGAFNAADLVIMQKWILNSDKIISWEAADLCRDGIIDIFDLCLMKQMLAEQ